MAAINFQNAIAFGMAAVPIACMPISSTETHRYVSGPTVEIHYSDVTSSANLSIRTLTITDKESMVKSRSSLISELRTLRKKAIDGGMQLLSIAEIRDEIEAAREYEA